MAKGDPRISWQVEEYNHREKGPDWYWALGVIALAGATTAVIFHNTLFAIFIVLAALLLGMYANRKPDIVDIAISEEGITLRSYFYPFDKIKGFAIDENPLGNHLLIESDRLVAPLISIPIPFSIDTEALSALLKTRLPVKPLKEHVYHRLMEHIGF